MSQSKPPRRGPGGGSRRPARSGPPASKSRSSIEPLHPTLEPPDIKSFHEWNLGDELQGAIAAMGITTPTPIQRLAIQPVLDGRDVIAKAETGTGKTLAFGAPMMAKIDPQRASVLGLVLCPTRELAEQGQKVLEILGKTRGVKVALVVGGEPLEPQVAALKAGAQVVVGTPGRILDLYKQRFLSFPWTEFAILDEADVMLEIGFIDDVKLILSYMPDERQTLLFSATFPPELLKLAREYTKNPVEVATASGVSTVDNITQSWISVNDDDRPLTLIRLIEQSEPDDVFLVFCDRRTEVDKLMRRLERLSFSIKALHGGYDQAARFRVMSAFRTGEVKVLVATDVASRGLDVAHVTTVLNYSAPRDITDYTHRIGRTGRAGRQGRAITLVGGSIDMRRWGPIQREATWKIPEAPAPTASRPPPRRPQRWPVDQDAHDETVVHGDLRPNRESPRRPDRGGRTRSPSGDRRPAPRSDRPREQSEARRSEPAREQRPAASSDRSRSAASSDRARSSPPPARRDAPPPSDRARDDSRSDRDHSSSQSDRARSARSDRAPAATTPDRERSAPRPSRERSDVQPNRERSERPRGGSPREASRPAGGSAPSRSPSPPARRDEAPRTEARRPARDRAPERAPDRAPRGRSERRSPALDERPPGTFERPLSGGLLGQSARRSTPARPPEDNSDRRPRGRRNR
ncbi:MAG: DEAD/DEAH box helicase [Planctomycetes bacterium]|nr:DEAD/DEAH box helicase [Planctomycetota bacterium]